MRSPILPIALIASCLASATAGAQNSNGLLNTQVLAQRNCTGDVEFYPGITQATSSCTWLGSANDSTTSLTTHINDDSIEYIAASCTVDGVSGDKVTQVSGQKAADITDVKGLETSTITFTLKKKGSDNNANILFRLNYGRNGSGGYMSYLTGNADYHNGSKIDCTFTLHRKVQPDTTTAPL